MARTKLTEDRPSKINRAGRPKRVPINGYRNRLEIKGQEPGWHYCIVNDYNIERYQEAGYEFVEHECTIGDKRIDVASVQGQNGGRICVPVGNGVIGFAMRCTEEDYQDENGIIDAETDETDMMVRQQASEDGRYGKVELSDPAGSNRRSFGRPTDFKTK